MPQYLPIQPLQPMQQPQQPQSQISQQLPQQQQSNPSIFPTYGQFPSTYPYNTLNPAQFFDQSFQQNIQPNTTTVNPAIINPSSSSAGMYAPIPFVNQSLQPGIQPSMTSMSSNGGGGGQQFPPQLMPSTGQGPPTSMQQQHPRHLDFAVEITDPPPRGVYIDDNRNVKRPKIEQKRTISLPFPYSSKVQSH
jgi:hypothetical protein